MLIRQEDKGFKVYQIRGFRIAHQLFQLLAVSEKKFEHCYYLVECDLAIFHPSYEGVKYNVQRISPKVQWATPYQSL